MEPMLPNKGFLIRYRVLILPNIEDFVTRQRVRICIGSRVAVVPDPCKDLVRNAGLITEVVGVEGVVVTILQVNF